MSYLNYEFISAVRILAGLDALAQLPRLVQSTTEHPVLILTDQGIVQANAHMPVLQQLDRHHIPYILFKDIPTDGSIESIALAKTIYQQQHCEMIISIGGGSVIDTAKVLNIAVSLGDDIEKYMGVNNIPHRLQPFIVIPTTAGTGSEVTSVAVVADNHKKIKMIYNSPYLQADYAILDPQMTLRLPPYISAMTAMDALTHAIEAYTCKARNPLSSELAISAICKIMAFLPDLFDDPQNQNARLALAEASTMAGMAFSNSMVGLTHAIAHALGINFKIPHGLCCSILLPHVLQYNLPAISEQLSELSLYILGEQQYCAALATNRAQAVIEQIHQLLIRLQQKSSLPYRLSELHKISIDDFDFIAKKALGDGSIIYNPIHPTQTEIIQILHDAW